MSTQEIQKVLKNIYIFTQRYEIKDLILSSKNYALILEEIAKNQDVNSYELTQENEKIFGKLLNIKTFQIIELYKNANDCAEISGFNKSFLRSIPNNTEYNDAILMAIQFFALIRNKEKRFKEQETLMLRRDEMKGLQNHMEQMNNSIKKYMNIYV